MPASAAVSLLHDEFNFAADIAEDRAVQPMLLLLRMCASATRPGIRRNVRYSSHK